VHAKQAQYCLPQTAIPAPSLSSAVKIVILDSPSCSSFSSSRPISHNLPNCTFLNFNLDGFLTGSNTRRLRKMLIQARWDEMRQKLQVVKSAYVSRHYAQCAKYGERLLAEVQGEVSSH
jgi:hypothetical protein